MKEWKYNMLDTREFARKLDQIQDSGSLRQQSGTMMTALTAVNRYVSELKGEIELAKQASVHARNLVNVTKKNATGDPSEQDRLEEKNLQDLFDKATMANRKIDTKKSALRDLAKQVDNLNRALSEFR